MLVCLLFLGCRNEWSSPMLFYISNNSNLSITATFYLNPNNVPSNITRQVSVSAGQTLLIQEVPRSPGRSRVLETGSSMGTDSVKVVFSDGKMKTDVHCLVYSSSPATLLDQCLQDTISIYRENRQDSKTGYLTYKIDNADYLEAR